MIRTLLACLVLTACATVPVTAETLSVGEVWARHHELDGKPIRVEGVITRCQSLGCALKESTESDARWVSIGASSAFDRRAQTVLGKRIIVEGRFRADCLHAFADDKREDEATMVICTDRASMLMKPRLTGFAK